MDNKIKQALSSINNVFSERINSVLDACDSPIEKALLIFILHKIQNTVKITSQLSFGIKHESDMGASPPENSWLYENSLTVWFSSFVFEDIGQSYENFTEEYIDSLNEGSFEKEGKESTYLNEYNQEIRRDIIIEPQHIQPITGTDKYYAIDIAVIERVYLSADKKYMITNKIAIECDGHDFHSSKEQITKDNRRARYLTIKGWKVIRYSGSEIYRDSNNKMEKICNEILELIKF